MKKLLILMAVLLLAGCQEDRLEYDSCEVSTLELRGLEYVTTFYQLNDTVLVENEDELVFSFNEGELVLPVERTHFVCSNSTGMYDNKNLVYINNDFTNRSDLQILFSISNDSYAQTDTMTINTVFNTQKDIVLGHYGFPTEILITNELDELVYSSTHLHAIMPIVYETYNGINTFNLDIPISDMRLEPGTYTLTYKLNFALVESNAFYEYFQQDVFTITN